MDPTPKARHQIPLHSRSGVDVTYAVVSPEDHEGLSAFRWYRNNNGYAVRFEKTRAYLMHRVILGLAPGDRLEGDHINGDKLDNRRENLRAVTHAQNTQNRNATRGSTSRFRAVHWSKTHGKWRARPRVDGHYYHLGFFKTEEAAAAAVHVFLRDRVPFALPDPAFVALGEAAA